MNSDEYFARAEKANSRYRKVMVIMGLCVTVGLTATILILFKINQTNHDNSVETLTVITQNEVKLNQNLSNSIQCILLLTPQTYNPTNVNNCFAARDNLQTPKVK